MGHVQLTPGGIAYTDLKHSVAVVSVPWDDMVGIADYVKSSDGPRKTIALRLKDKTRQTIDDADLYAPNGYALYWMVRHYWRHAEDRPELTDGRALERLEAGRFDVTVP